MEQKYLIGTSGWGYDEWRGPFYPKSLKKEEYLTYYDIYSDTSLVWLSWDSEFGKRAEVVTNYVPGLIDSINSHLVKIHLENDLY